MQNEAVIVSQHDIPLLQGITQPEGPKPTGLQSGEKVRERNPYTLYRSRAFHSQGERERFFSPAGPESKFWAQLADRKRPFGHFYSITVNQLFTQSTVSH